MAETLDPPARVTEVMTLIRQRHADRVQAMVYYGSSLRELDNPEKMLDFYVLVDSYRKTHGTGPRALINRYIPPAVYYVEHASTDGTLSTCKYSILSLSEFEKRCSPRAFLSQVWGRFSQPCAVLWAKNDEVLNRVWAARVVAVNTMAEETAPLLKAPPPHPNYGAVVFMKATEQNCALRALLEEVKKLLRVSMTAMPQ